MEPTNGTRIILCGLVAGAVYALLNALFLSLIAPDFFASVQESARQAPLSWPYFLAIDVAMGIWVVWLYAAIEPRYGASAQTTLIAGVAWWTLKTLQSAKWGGLAFVDLGLELLSLGVATLVACVVATFAGVGLYRRGRKS
jgi:hypothetical protein